MVHQLVSGIHRCGFVHSVTVTVASPRIAGKSLLLAQLIEKGKKTVGNLFGRILFKGPSQILVYLLLDCGLATVVSLRCHYFVSPGNLVRTSTNL
nr:hypothetical protein [Paracoccus sediminis]